MRNGKFYFIYLLSKNSKIEQEYKIGKKRDVARRPKRNYRKLMRG